MTFIEHITMVCLIGASIGILLLSWCGLCILINKLTKGWLEKTIVKFFTSNE